MALPAIANHGVAESGTQVPQERPLTQEERAARTLVSVLTGAGTSSTSEGGAEAEGEEDGEDGLGRR